MHVVWTILIGFVVGLIARLLTRGSGRGGFFVTAALGVAGSLLATNVGRFLGWFQAGQPASFVCALVGAILLLAGYHLLTKPPPY